MSLESGSSRSTSRADLVPEESTWITGKDQTPNEGQERGRQQISCVIASKTPGRFLRNESKEN